MRATGATAACAVALAGLARVLRVGATGSITPMATLGGDPTLHFTSVDHPRQPGYLSSTLSQGPLPTNDWTTNWLIGADDNAKDAYLNPLIVGRYNSNPYGIAFGIARRYGTPDETGYMKGYQIAYDTPRALLYVAEWDGEKPTLEFVDIGGGGIYATVRMYRMGFDPYMDVPIVEGQAFLTAIFDGGATPVVAVPAGAVITEVNGEAKPSTGTMTVIGEEFIIATNANQVFIAWFLDGAVTLTVEGRDLKASAPYTGVVRVMAIFELETDGASAGSANMANAVTTYTYSLLKDHYKVYPTGVDIETSVDGNTGSYTLNWKVAGKTSEQKLLHFTLPHHRDSMKAGATATLLSREAGSTKGKVVAYVGNSWTMEEPDLPFSAWPSDAGVKPYLLPKEPIPNDELLAAVKHYLYADVAQMSTSAATGASIYWGGKNMYKNAMLCVMADAVYPELRDPCLDKVKAAFDIYFAGTNGNPMQYDRTYGGIIGSGGLGADNPLDDYGNTYYNDHHYHYGYHLTTAAIVGAFDPSWAATNEDWFNFLIRDVANPSDTDEYFPYFRAFEWFHGHSWSKGIVWAGSGKDQESTSEEVNFYYGMFLWGQVIGNDDIRDLGRLIMAVDKRAIQRYFLMTSDNDVHPAEFVQNKVPGILFETKCDYATWFGAALEYMHGIQILPVTPFTEEVRTAQFCREEWDERLVELTPYMKNSWQSILYMSYAVFNKYDAFEKLREADLDSGLSRSWALYWAATRPTDCSPWCIHETVEHAALEPHTGLCLYDEDDACTLYEDYPCPLILSLSQRDQGVGIMYDASCECGGTGCSFMLPLCRLCRVSGTGSTDLYTCPDCVAKLYSETTVKIDAVVTSSPTPSPTAYVALAEAAPSPYVTDENLVWSDEFEGTSETLSDKWDFITGDGTDYGLPAGWGNSEKQWYTDETTNVRTEFGRLFIVAQKADGYTMPYTSARIKSKVAFKYGRFEAKMKLPAGSDRSGLWPALWMLPQDDTPYGGWATSGEIDIMEAADLMDFSHARIHFGHNYPANDNSDNFEGGACKARMYADFSEDFHVYAMEWEWGEFRWYVDDVLYCKKNFWYSRHDTALYDYPAPFDHAFHLIINLALGGTYTSGFVDETNALPATLLVEYIKVYQTANQRDRSTTIDGSDPVEHHHLGCYQDYAASDTANARVMSHGPISYDGVANQELTVEVCLAYCDASGYKYFGVEDGTMCFCDHTFLATLESAWCNVDCLGDKSDPASICGGGLALSAYVIGPAPAPSPSTADAFRTSSEFTYEGCYKDQAPYASRELNKAAMYFQTAPSPGLLTPELCAAFCRDEGATYFGLQYEYECWCGDNAPDVGEESTVCNMPCLGDDTVICGGLWSNSVYKLESTLSTSWEELVKNIDTPNTLLMPVCDSTTLAQLVFLCGQECLGMNMIQVIFYTAVWGSVPTPTGTISAGDTALADPNGVYVYDLPAGTTKMVDGVRYKMYALWKYTDPSATGGAVDVQFEKNTIGADVDSVQAQEGGVLLSCGRYSPETPSPTPISSGAASVTPAPTAPSPADAWEALVAAITYPYTLLVPKCSADGVANVVFLCGSDCADSAMEKVVFYSSPSGGSVSPIGSIKDGDARLSDSRGVYVFTVPEGSFFEDGGSYLLYTLWAFDGGKERNTIGRDEASWPIAFSCADAVPPTPAPTAAPTPAPTTMVVDKPYTTLVPECTEGSDVFARLTFVCGRECAEEDMQRVIFYAGRADTATSVVPVGTIPAGDARLSSPSGVYVYEVPAMSSKFVEGVTYHLYALWAFALDSGGNREKNTISADSPGWPLAFDCPE